MDSYTSVGVSFELRVDQGEPPNDRGRMRMETLDRRLITHIPRHSSSNTGPSFGPSLVKVIQLRTTPLKFLIVCQEGWHCLRYRERSNGYLSKISWSSLQGCISLGLHNITSFSRVLHKIPCVSQPCIMLKQEHSIVPDSAPGQRC